MNRRTCFLPLMILATALASPATAGYVTGISVISAFTDGVYTSSSTEVDYDTAYWYEVKTDAQLRRDNGTLVASGSLRASDFFVAVYLNAPAELNHEYDLDSIHILVARYHCGEGDLGCGGGEGGFYDYYGYGLIAGGGGNPGDTVYSPDQPTWYVDSEIPVLTTRVYDTTYPPHINHGDLYGNATRGSSGYVKIFGTDLAKVAGETTVTISVSGLSLSIVYWSYDDPWEVDISYSIPATVPTGNYNLTVTTPFGTSNAVTFTVSDPTPVISQIDPSTWYAGTSRNVTIAGTGFGSSPTVAITATGVSKSIQSASDTQIVLQVSVDSSASDQSDVPVTVTSNGYNGNNFLPPQAGGGGNQATASTQVASVHIFRDWNPNTNSGVDVTRQTTTVIIGENVQLTAIVNGQPANGGNWSFSFSASNSVVGAWTPNEQSSGTPGTVVVANATVSPVHFTSPTPPGSTETVDYHIALNGVNLVVGTYFNVVAPILMLLPRRLRPQPQAWASAACLSTEPVTTAKTRLPFTTGGSKTRGFTSRPPPHWVAIRNSTTAASSGFKWSKAQTDSNL